MRRLFVCLFGVLALARRRRVHARPAIQKLPMGAGAIGKGPDALTPPGYEDVPRPPAFNDAVRKENARIIQLVDNYTPQPAFAGRRVRRSRRRSRPTNSRRSRRAVRPVVVRLPARRPHPGQRDQQGPAAASSKDGKPIRYIPGLPIDFSKRAQQLLDIVPDKDFARNRAPSSSCIAFRPRRPATSARAKKTSPSTTRRSRWSDAASFRRRRAQLTDVQVLLNTQGIEGRMLQAPDGSLFIDSGPLAGRGMLSRNWTQSQLPGSLMGKVLHINADGSIPRDNPFIGKADTRPEIWAFGVRDAQSMAFDAAGRLWTAENGAMGGDELNLIEKGKNYGFPTIGYGREYNGELINGGLTAKEGLEQPVYFWTPSSAPSGMTFYSGDLFPEWKGDLFIATHVAALRPQGHPAVVPRDAAGHARRGRGVPA